MLMRTIVFSLLTLLLSCHGAAQEVIRLWDGQPKPYAKTNSVEEYEASCWKTTCVYGVTEPSLTVYRASGKNSGRAVIVLPGGGYEAEAIYHEGYDVARALSRAGITAAVLKYRLPDPRISDHPERVPLSDVRRAIQLLRSRSETYNIQADKVGLMGFSAGSHLATVASLWPVEEPQQKPDFSALIYGVSRLTKENREWLEKSLYHRELTDAEVEQNTLLERISSEAPPAFLVHALDDTVCHYTESTLYAEALTRRGVPVEMHLFANGGHGFGLGREADGTSQWIELAANWIKRR
jgi:acetyl esterase/lipase